MRIRTPGALAALACAALACAGAARARPADPLRSVDPFIGTGGHGHTFPGATVPFGMVQLSPDTRVEGWDACSGYHDSDSLVLGFSHTHLSGTGVGDYCDVLLMPATGVVRWRSGAGQPPGAGFGSRFRKSAERATPGSYAVTLDDSGIFAELTATARTGMHRYTFPASDSAFVLLDLRHRDEVLESSLKLVGDREIEGLRRSRSWARDQRVYFVARCSKPFSALIAVDGAPDSSLREASGTSLAAALRFATRAGERVIVKVGLSAVSADGARKNLDAENPGWDFDAVRRSAADAWRAALARIEIEGGTPAQDSVFYTALYHTLLQPNLYTDVDGRYRGRDGAVHEARGWTQYTVFSLWDTFRAAHPLYTLLEPERTADFVRTFLAQYREGGRLPVWELAACETDCMIGYHAASVIADAWAKGIRGFDGDEALAAMRAGAMRDDRGLASYRAQGCVAGERESESVSKTLEYAYDDWCIAQLAGALGNADVRGEFLARGRSWRNVLDPATGFMRPRLNGRFKSPFDPTEVDFHFTEANSWQYSFFVPQDVAGHIAALGGPAAYAAKLDSLFETKAPPTGREQADITGLYGQYAHGNEPSHHIAYLYCFAGQPWKTQARVRRILDSLYSARRDGLAGNEDCGQMSAWYVLSALGFYSVTPGQDEYVIGTPLFRRATLKLASGRAFTIAADHPSPETPYVQSATLNGRPFERCFLRHAELLAGGRLELKLGPAPSRTWGVGPGRQPVSRIDAAPVTAAPYVAAGDYRFRGRTRVTLACADTGASLRYTLDGSEPGPGSPEGSAPLEIAESCTLRFRASAPGAAPSPVQESAFHRIAGNRRVQSCTAPHRAYTADGPDALIDGVRGGDDFRVGAWMGFYGVDLDVVVDLGEEREIRRLATGFLQDQNSWIFMPLSVRFETSRDGVRFEPAGEAANTVDEHAEGAVRRDFPVAPSPRRARYVRVHAKAPVMCPAWHKGAGNRSFIFADEVVIE